MMKNHLRNILKEFEASKMHIYFVLFMIIVYVTIWATGIDLSEIQKIDHLWPLRAFYFMSPFIFTLSIWRIFTYKDRMFYSNVFNIERQLKTNIKDIFKKYEGSTTTTTLLNLLETDLEYKVFRKSKKLFMIEHIGRAVVLTSLLIPITTWIIAIELYDDKDTLNNLWAMTFSSMTAGFIMITVGVTMLRNAKAMQMNINDIESKILYFRKIRIVLLSTPDTTENNSLHQSIYANLIENNLVATPIEKEANENTLYEKLLVTLIKQQKQT